MQWMGSSLRWRDGKQPVWGRLPWTPHLTHTPLLPPCFFTHSSLPPFFSLLPSSPPSLLPPSFLPIPPPLLSFLFLLTSSLPPSLPPSLFLFLPPSLSLPPPPPPPPLPQVAGEDEGVREKAIEYVSSSLMSMRHHLFIPHPDNEKHLMGLVKKVGVGEGGREREGKVYSTT